MIYGFGYRGSFNMIEYIRCTPELEGFGVAGFVRCASCNTPSAHRHSGTFDERLRFGNEGLRFFLGFRSDF